MGAAPASTTLLVCVTCRRATPAPAVEPARALVAVDASPRAADPVGAGAAEAAPDIRPGAAMLDALEGGQLPAGMRLRAVECLSACSSGCAVALTGPGRWTYVYGNLDPAEHPAEILRGAAAYATAPDGLVPWRDRPLVFRRNAIARVPPPDMDIP
jgi:predicted metal-binding protein